MLLRKKKSINKNMLTLKDRMDGVEVEAVNPIIYDPIVTSSGEFLVTNIYNLAAGYYSEQDVDTPLIYDADIAHRRLSLSRLFENRVKNAIIQAYRGAYAKVLVEYKNYRDNMFSHDEVYFGYIQEFMEKYIIPKYGYIFDISSYLHGGIFTNTANIIDCIIALSSEFDVNIAQRLGYSELEYYPNHEDKYDKDFVRDRDYLLNQARAKLSVEFSVELAKQYTIILRDFNIYYNAGITNKQLETL